VLLEDVEMVELIYLSTDRISLIFSLLISSVGQFPQDVFCS
jgi:hypothetical protein